MTKSDRIGRSIVSPAMRKGQNNVVNNEIEAWQGKVIGLKNAVI